MTQQPDGHFLLSMRFPPGSRLVYKLIVDGVWSLDPDAPTETDAAGNRNHVLYVPDFLPERPALRLPGLAIAGEPGGGPDGGGTPRALGYIGAGVHREYSEEYGLEVDVSSTRGKGGVMARSVSFADVGSLVHLVQTAGAKGSGKGVSTGVAGADKGLIAGLGGARGKLLASLSVSGAAAGSTAGVNDAAAAPSAATPAVSLPSNPSTVAAPAADAAMASVASEGLRPVATAVAAASSALLGSVVPHRTGSAGSMPRLAPSAPLSTVVQASLRREGKLVLSMVGLPARGKTFIARRLKRHLTWLGYRAEIYNVGNCESNLHAHRSHPRSYGDPCFGDPSLPQTAASTTEPRRVRTSLTRPTPRERLRGARWPSWRAKRCVLRWRRMPPTSPYLTQPTPRSSAAAG